MRITHLFIQTKSKKDFLSSVCHLPSTSFLSLVSDGDWRCNIPGILNSTRTSLGRRLLRNWFLRPSLSLSIITSRHDALSCFLRPENLVTANTMHAHLKFGNIPHVFTLLRGGKAGVREWQAVVKVCREDHFIADIDAAKIILI